MPRSNVPRYSPRPQPVDRTVKVRVIWSLEESLDVTAWVRMHSATTVSLAVKMSSENVWTPTTIGVAWEADRASSMRVEGVAITQEGEFDSMNTDTEAEADVVNPRDILYSYKPVSAIVPSP